MPPTTRKRAAVKTPTDRKPRTAKRAPAAKRVAAAATGAGPDFTFSHEGKTYRLPNALAYAEVMTGGDLMDSVLDGDPQAEIRMTFAALKAAKDDTDPEAWAAIRSKPALECVTLVSEWLEAARVSPGK